MRIGRYLGLELLINISLENAHHAESNRKSNSTASSDCHAHRLGEESVERYTMILVSNWTHRPNLKLRLFRGK